MSKVVYRLLSPSAAIEYIGKSDYRVWGYVTDAAGPHAVTCGAGAAMPADAYAAIVAAIDVSFTAGELLFDNDLASDKDPQSPPPPPALQSAIAAYVTSGEVASYRDDVQRDLSRPA